MSHTGPTQPGSDVPPKRGIGAIETGLTLIDVLASAAGPMQLKEIAAEAGMPPAKAHRYLASFITGGMVSQSGPSGRYDLGPMALRLGAVALGRFDVIETACSRLQGLRDDIRATCFVTGWSDKGPVILRWEDSQRPVTVIVQVGSTMPLLTSATGRAFLAYLPRESTGQLVARELAADVADYDEDHIQDLIEQTRAVGLGRTDGEFQPGICALAAPLTDPFGHMVGAVAALGRSVEFDGATDGAVAKVLREFAKTLGTTAS